jgi:hypothetical protein
MTEWQDQEARNETVFRDLNEWTREDNDLRLGRDRPSDTYLCECGDRSCTEPIELTPSEYEEIRTEPLRFLIALNHENPDSDTVLLENARFATVEKIYGEPSRIARATDPRRDG